MSERTSAHRQMGARISQKRWLPAEAGNDINECEMLAVVTWMEIFGPALPACDVQVFVESTAAEGALLRAYSANVHLTALTGFWGSSSQDGVNESGSAESQPSLTLWMGLRDGAALWVLPRVGARWM